MSKNLLRNKRRSLAAIFSILALMVLPAIVTNVHAAAIPLTGCTYADTVTFDDTPSTATVSVGSATLTNGENTQVGGGTCPVSDLTANSPGSGYTFEQWNVAEGGSNCVAIGSMTSASTTISATCDGSDTVYATWQSGSSCSSVTLDFVASPSADGSVSPSGIISGEPCSGTYDNIAATPNSGYAFVDWTLACPGSHTCSVSTPESTPTDLSWDYEKPPTGDLVVTANFEASSCTVTLDIQSTTVPSGSGGTTSPSGSTNDLPCDENSGFGFTITNDSGYYDSYVSINEPSGGTTSLFCDGIGCGNSDSAYWDYTSSTTITVTVSFAEDDWNSFAGIANYTWITGAKTGCTDQTSKIQDCPIMQVLEYNVSSLYAQNINDAPAYTVSLMENIYKSGSTYYKEVELCATTNPNSATCQGTYTEVTGLATSWDYMAAGCIDIINGTEPTSTTTEFWAFIGGSCKVSGNPVVLSATISGAECPTQNAMGDEGSENFVACNAYMPLVVGYPNSTGTATLTVGKANIGFLSLNTYGDGYWLNPYISTAGSLESSLQSANIDYTHPSSETTSDSTTYCGVSWGYFDDNGNNIASPSIQGIHGSSQHFTGDVYYWWWEGTWNAQT